MNEFEWLRQMRDLRQPVAPSDALWTRIDAALSGDAGIPAQAPPRRWLRRLPGLGIAAALVMAGWLGGHLQQRLQQVPMASAALSAPSWKPADPRLAAAAIELDAARTELRQALQQAPASPALRQLLMNTERQQASLRQLERRAG
jgi:hypothetical protein